MGTILRIVLPLVAGSLIALSLPPFGLWPLALGGVGLLSRLLEGLSWKMRLATGVLGGIGQFAIGLTWAWQFNAGGFAVLAIVEALFIAVACVLTPGGRGRILAFVGLLTLAEVVRQSWPFGGLPLAGIALGQVGGPLADTARLGGSLFLTGVTYLAGAGLGELARRPTRRSIAGGIAVGLAVAVAVWGALASDGGPPVRTLRVAIVQGGGARGLDQLQVPPSTVYEAALRPTLRLRPPLDLVLWPEDVVAVGNGLTLLSVNATLGAITRRLDATLVAGVTEPVGTTRFLNEVEAIGPSGRVVATFEKVHRVPFGEYVPYRWFFSHLANLSDIPRDAIPGTGSGMIDTPAGRLAVLISFEVLFPDRGRSGVRAGGELIIVPTNTSSYSSGQAPAQEVAASRLQAIEEGRDVLQAAPTGYSGVISNDGAVLELSTLGAEDVIETTVPLRTGATLYNRLGDLPTIVLGALAALAGWILAFRRRSSDRQGRLF
jgi:apolipoprotein N-acyltransferase